MFSPFSSLTPVLTAAPNTRSSHGSSPLVTKLLAVLFATMLAIALSSCGSKEEPEPFDEPEPEPAPEVVEPEPEPEPVVIERLGPGECIPNCNLPRDAIDDPNGNLVDRVVNFEFDEADLNEEDKDTLRYHAEYLTSWPDVVITLDGHADERGSREYNLALGFRRSNATKSFLVSLGVGGNQLKVRSFGEDNPVVSQSNEFSWAQNRRAELVYE